MKIAFGILIALIAASPAAAAKKSKKMVAAEPPAATAANPNDAGWRFVRDSLPIYYPTAVKAIIYPVGSKQK
jgi:hypothetical protein